MADAEEGHKVALNIYDLSQGLARQLSSSFLGKAIEGIWHTGIVVFGNEYYFGGGIQSCPQGETPYGKPCKVLDLGFTQVPMGVFEDYLREISPRYTTDTYSLLQHNCNNFSDEVAQFLLGTSIPDFILKLPQEVMNSPMGALIMPMIQQFETILRYGGIPQVPCAGSPQGSLNFSQIQASPNAPVCPTSTDIASRKSSSNQTTDMRSEHVVPSASMSVRSPRDICSKASVKNLENVAGDTDTTITDKLGEARARVQEEITCEFAVLMAEGHLRASEAAALATRRVMERHGISASLTSQS